MKKVLKIIAGIVVVLIIAMAAIPFFVDVDKYRPQIIQAAHEHMNGSLELGHLKLSLWGKVRIEIDGMNVRDAQNRSLVSVKDASFDVPFSSVLAGAPLITLHMAQPSVNVVKGRDGKLNVMSLMKVSAAPATTTTGTAQSTAGAKSESKMELPAMAMNARFGVFIENAKVVYQDEGMGLTNTIDQLNLRVKDFSLNRKTELELWADLKTQMTGLRVEGPIKLIAELTPEVSGGEFKSAAVDATFTADDLEIEKGTLFHKKKGDLANFKFKGTLGQDSLKLDQALAKFHNAEIEVSGNYAKEVGANIHFGAKPIELKSWGELIPMLKEYELEGKIGLNGDVKGKPEAIQYNAKVSVENLAMKGPNLKAKPVINATIDIATDRLEKIYVDLRGPGNEMVLNAKVVSFSRPQITFDLKSPKGMDLDQWIEFPKTEPASTKTAGGGSNGESAKKGEASAEDYDAMLDPLRKNEMAKEMVIDGSVAFAFIKAKGVRIDDLAAKIQMKNLVAAISGLRMKMFDGTIGGSMNMDMKPKAPQYTMGLNVANLDLAKAVESQFASFKNTVVGKLNTSIQGGGSSFNPDLIKRRLQVKGDFKVLNATFKSMDIGKMAGDAINGSLGKMAGKIPGLSGKKLGTSNQESKYDVISSNFTINNGTLDAPNFVAKAAPKQGVDIKGTTKMGLVDESLDAHWELIDSQHMTGADQISVNVAGTTINNILAKSEKDPVIIPISVGCKWSAPCVNYQQVAEYLAGIAAGRLTHAAPDVVKQKAMDTGKKAIGNVLKGLFGH